MNDQKLKVLVDYAVKLARRIEQLSKELSDIKAALVAEAESRPDEAQPTEGGGTSHTFEGMGMDGCIVRVTVAGPTLKSAIKDGSKDSGKIAKLLAAYPKPIRDGLFDTVTAYRPVADFRDRCDLWLSSSEAKKIIKLCESTGKTTVSFETKESAT